MHFGDWSVICFVTALEVHVYAPDCEVYLIRDRFGTKTCSERVAFKMRTPKDSHHNGSNYLSSLGPVLTARLVLLHIGAKLPMHM